MMRPVSPRHEWESHRAVADRMQNCLDGGYALIRLGEIDNDIERLQIQTIATEQIRTRRRQARQAEKFANDKYRR